MANTRQKKRITHLIWGNINLNFKDWEEDLKENYPDLPDSELENLMYELNNDYLADERHNLDIQLNQTIIKIADVGRWDGKYKGYGLIQSGNIADCLQTELDSAEWFVDELGDLRCKAIHHDGTNYYLYRAIKPMVSDIQLDNFYGKILDGTVTRADITRVTERLGDHIANVYGWELPKIKTKNLKERR